MRMIGKYWSPDELVETLLRDIPFYRHSGGGVTLSGGECAMFPDYVRDLLQRLKTRNIHVALETSGYFEWEAFSGRMLPHLNLILFNVKIADPEESVRFLGRSSKTILQNLRRLLAQHVVEVQVRIPIIPGITDKNSNFGAIVNLLRAAGAETVSLLPYNPLGLAMYPRLGRPVPDLPQSFTTPEREEYVLNTFRNVVAERASQLCQRAKPEAVAGTLTAASAGQGED